MQGVNVQIAKSCKVKSKISLKSVKFTNNHPQVQLYPYLGQAISKKLAMDLKIYHGQNIFHLIDLCIPLSAAAFIPIKNRKTIIKHIFCIWIAVYGTPQKFLTDNGGDLPTLHF